VSQHPTDPPAWQQPEPGTPPGSYRPGPAPGGYGSSPAQVAAGSYATGYRTPTSTIVLVVVSALATFTGILALAGIPAGVLGILALLRGRDAPDDARRLTRIGWIVFAAVCGVMLLAVVVMFAALFAYSTTSVSSGVTLSP
jgi:hypothetical protein